MIIYKEESYEKMSERAAEIIASQLMMNEYSILGLATGSTPVGTYKKLIEMNKAGKISFKNVKTVNLDEYHGLGPDHPCSYRFFMNDNLFNHVDIDKKNTNVPDGLASDGEAECKRYDEVIKSLGRADIQILGIGENGHIAFNEPSDHFSVGTHIENLTQSTMDANKRFFEDGEKVPNSAFTMGIGGIMNAKCIILLANGEKKAKAVKDSITGKVTPQVPASVLQLHPNVIVIGDKDAMKFL